MTNKKQTDKPTSPATTVPTTKAPSQWWPEWSRGGDEADPTRWGSLENGAKS